MLYFFFERELFIVTILWAGYVFSALCDITWFFSGLENFKLIIKRNVVLKMMTLMSIFILVKGVYALQIYISVVSLGTLLGQVALWKVVKKYVTFSFRFDCKAFLIHLKGCLVLFIPVVAVSVYTILNKIMLGYLSSMGEIAFFDNAQKVVAFPVAIVTSLGNIMLPRIAFLVKDDNHKAVYYYIELSMQFTVLLSIAISFGISAVAPLFAYIYFGENYILCGDMMQFLSVVIVFIAWANVIRMQFLIPSQNNFPYLLAVVIGALINVLLNYYLIPLHGAWGVIFSTIITEFCVAFIQTWCVKDELPIKTYFRQNVAFIFVGMLMFVCIKFTNSILSENLLSLCLQIFIGIVIYGVCSVLILRNRKAILWKKIEDSFMRWKNDCWGKSL